jgi:ligand-binding sensor domain-containing protein/DNA-directed RNA polymerase specialized sigma24 family protein
MYPIQNFTPADYKAGIQNIDFAQNRDMTLFVANNLSVLSFNGDEWNQHHARTGKKNRALAFDEGTNRLYVGSQGEFGYFLEDWQYISLLDKVPEDARDFDEVWDVFLLNDNVYFCTFQGIYIFDGTSIQVIKKEEGLGRSFLVKGKLFTQSHQGKLFEIQGTKLIATHLPIQIEQVISGIIAHEEGYLIFHNSGEIELTSTFGVNLMFQDLIQELKGTFVNHVLQLSDTRLAISTQTSGLFLYDMQNKTLEKITAQTGLATNACLRSFQDFYGNLWVGMQNGIALIHINSPMRLLSKEINIQGSGYEAYETEEGTYFTTSNGIYFLANNSKNSVFLSEANGPAYGIQEIAGKLYAGHHTGLFLLENGTAKRIASTDGMWKVKQLQTQPKFAIGGTYSGLYLFKIDENQTLKPVQKIDGFNSSSRFFEEDEFGKIWVGQYYKGLYQLLLSEDLSEANAKKVSKDSSSSISNQIVLSRVANELFLATNVGLNQLIPRTGAIKAEYKGFTDIIGEQQVYLFEQDQKNNVHVLAENTVGFFKQISNGNYQFIPSSLYQLRFHLNNDLLHASVNTQHGVLFSANEGFIHYDPNLEYLLKIEQPLAISQVYSVTENKALYSRKPFELLPSQIANIEVSPKAKVLKIDVESFQFNDLNTTRFRYLLKGFDENFGEWTNSTTKEYTNLKEGDYEFIAQTQNYLGKITTSQTVYITVKPPFYRSTLAKIFYVVGGILLIILGARFQRRRYKRKAQRLEESKQQKLEEVEQQKEKELLQLKEEKIQSELQHVNKLLAASTMNLVVKNEFIEAIKEELNTLKQSDRKTDTKKALEKIVKGIDTTLKLQEDWEQFEYHFDQVHGDFLIRLREEFPNLSPSEQKLCTLLRLNLNTKDIANLLSISLRGVEVARYRLRKKLNLEKGQNLSKFILQY